MAQKEYLAFDIGFQHTGVAKSFGSLAQPLATIEASYYLEQLEKMQALIKLHQPDVILIGSPGRGPINERVSQLAKDLAPLGEIEIIDETLSTKAAAKAMIEAGIPMIKRRRNEHQVVAAQLLQEYLDGLVD